VVKDLKIRSKIGLWIDHKEAYIVTLSENEASTKHIDSDVEKQPRRSGDSPMTESYEAQLVPADDSQQRITTEDLNHYYDAVIGHLQNAGPILIFGPGEAKNEFNKRFDGHLKNGKVVAIQTSDSMTENQIVAKVREYFEQ
jgi:hypothetical protein